MSVYIIGACCALLLAVIDSGVTAHKERVEVTKAAANRLLLISFDGFRYDYISKTKAAGYKLPNFDRFLSDGLQVAWLRNAFITKTFPNHFTLVTGLYEESHGIIGNNMYDPVLNRTFTVYTEEKNKPEWWSLGNPEPIWVTNQKHKGKTGVVFWPGSEADMGDRSPTRFLHYAESLKNETRIDHSIQWFLGNETEAKINLGLLYFSEPDALGHKLGPDSPEMLKMIVGLDKVVGYLIDALKKADLYSSTNIIITSDHGMAQVHDYIRIPKELSAMYTAYESPPVWNVRPHQGKSLEVYNGFKKIKNLRVYWKKDIAENMHYTKNRRIQEIVVVANNGYLMCDDVHSICESIERKHGGHGYSNAQPNMRPFFIARGPDIKNLGGAVVAPFLNVDVYALLCHLLDISPAPNNGSLTRSSVVLRDNGGASGVTKREGEAEEGVDTDPQRPIVMLPGGFTMTSVTMMVVILLSLSFSAICCVAALYSRQTSIKYKSRLSHLGVESEDYHVQLLDYNTESDNDS